MTFGLSNLPPISALEAARRRNASRPASIFRDQLAAHLDRLAAEYRQTHEVWMDRMS